jgi:uncharacterized protein YdbL (DUF1318 family)
MRFKTLIATFVLLMFIPAVALGLSLDQAKSQGLVGETPSGYIEAVGPAPSAAVTALVADINRRRKEEYQRISSERGAPLNSVEQLAGKKAIEKTPAGQYVMLPSGQWRKK